MNIPEVAESLIRLAHSARFSGYDPYDGLHTSGILGAILGKSRFGRLVSIHFHKRMPVNFRRYLSVKPGVNPKTLALYLSGMVKLHRVKEAEEVKDNLIAIRRDFHHHAAWGYYFPWQSRIFFLPQNTPTIVATSFVINALLDYYQATGSKEVLPVVEKSLSFITDDLQIFENEAGICFSYSPYDNSVIYNASALGLEVIARYLNISENANRRLTSLLEKGVNFIKSEQNEDGSWYYGKQRIQHFIDHYHTAYILESLENIRKYSSDGFGLYPVIRRGLDFYLQNMFTPDFAPRYYKNATYPIESHCSGAAIKALCTLGESFGTELFTLANKVAQWTIANMYDFKKGYFYYQKTRYWKNKINYLRWSQAWMFIGLSYLMYYEGKYGDQIN